MNIPTYREIIGDIERRGYKRIRCKGSHATYSDGVRRVGLCVKHASGHPTRHMYVKLSDTLGFKPGLEER